MSSLVKSLLNVAEASLLLLKSREENFYERKSFEFSVKLNKLKSDWYEEFNKDPSIRSDAVLDHIKLELCNFIDDYTAFIRAKGISNK